MVKMPQWWMLFMLSVPTAALAQRYSVVDLGLLSGQPVVAVGLNGAGQAAGSTIPASGPSQAVLFSDGVTSTLGTLGGATSVAYGIDASGAITGGSQTTSGAIHAFVYSNGTMQDLGLPGADFYYSAGSSINSLGQVAVNAISYSVAGQSFVYENGGMTNIGSLGGTSVSAAAINAAGQVAGTATTAGNAQSHAFLYSNGAMEDLGTLGGTWSGALAMNDSGEVVGNSQTAADLLIEDFKASEAFLYANGQMRSLGTLGGDRSTANGINASGQIVGISNLAVPDGVDPVFHAFVYSDGAMHDLNSLITGDATALYELVSAMAINDRGQILVDGYLNSDGEAVALLLTPDPVPLPTPAFLMLSGVAVLGGFARRATNQPRSFVHG